MPKSTTPSIRAPEQLADAAALRASMMEAVGDDLAAVGGPAFARRLEILREQLQIQRQRVEVVLDLMDDPPREFGEFEVLLVHGLTLRQPACGLQSFRRPPPTPRRKVSFCQ